MPRITMIFFDLGGVCLSNGWDHDQRKAVSSELGFDYDAFDSRHRQISDSLERGEISLNDYLEWTLFYEPRAFMKEEMIEAIHRQSTPMEESLKVVRALRASGSVELMTLNNESRELNDYRIERFGLRELFTCFFTSCYLGLTKPQPEIYRRALEITRQSPEECLFVDDRPMNVEVARILGIGSIQFTEAAQLAAELRAAGIQF